MTGVDLRRAEQLVVEVLLEVVRAVAGHPRHGEDRGENVGVQAELLVDEAAEEIDVRVDPSLTEAGRHDLLELEGDVVLRRAAEGLEELGREGLQVLGPRVLRLVDAVPEAHHLLLVRGLGVVPRLDLVHRPDGRELLEDALVGPAVEGPEERTDGAAARGVGVVLGRRHDAAREGARVHGVLGVQDQRAVEGPHRDVVGSLTVEAPEEVRGRGEVGLGLDVLLAGAHALERCHEDGSARDHPAAGLVLRGRVAQVGLGADHPQTREAGLEGLHGVGRGGHRLDHLHQRLRQLPQPAEIRLERRELLRGRQLPIEKQPRHLLVSAVGRQVLDLVAAVLQHARLPIDEADGRLGGGDACEAGNEFGVRHFGAPPKEWAQGVDVR